MSSVDGDINMNDVHDRIQDLEKIEHLITKGEKRESTRRGSVATPARPATSKFKTTPATKNRPIDSIEKDGIYDPVTPTKSSARAARSGPGRGMKMTRSQSPRKSASIKFKADKATKTRQSPSKLLKYFPGEFLANTSIDPTLFGGKAILIMLELTYSTEKKDTKKGLKNLAENLLGEALAGGDDNEDDFEDENDGVRSDENTWSQINKVIGSTGKATHPNGRAEGRKLVAWHRTRMMEKLILHIVFECRRSGIVLPWNSIAHRLCPGSSGTAAQQYLNRLREVLITEGHLVPPPLAKTTDYDSTIRGYIRDMDAEDPKITRPVAWDEEVADLKESLVIPGVFRGSGTYRRDKNRLPGNKASIAEETPTKMTRTDTRPNKQLTNSKAGTKEKSSKIKERSESLDPAEMPSDEDYNPGNRLNIKGSRKRKVKVKSERKYETDEDSDNVSEFEDESFGYSDNNKYLEETPSKKKGSEKHMMTPVASMPVELSLSPDVLSQFPAGITSNSAQEKFVGDDTKDNDIDEDIYGLSVGPYNDKETTINTSARDRDDVFGPEILSLNRNHGVELAPGPLFTNNYVAVTDPRYNLYNTSGPINVREYPPEHIPGYNTAVESHPFSGIGAASFENTHNRNPYSDNMFFDTPNFTPASALDTGIDDLAYPIDTIQGINGGHNMTDSFPLSTGVSSGNSSFTHSSANADYTPASALDTGIDDLGYPIDMIQGINGGHNMTDSFSLITGVNSGNSSFTHSSANTDYGGGSFNYDMADIAPDQHFESPIEGYQEYIADTLFEHDGH
ncbi:hypothetical protein DSL72_005303 [Monilinia vaccinii-corymbosi]|uniref:Uncharacterized protein n=1 Tax=Monilinia vaccinii-corymbosi TaxID=61207 RepID=A0A8A3PET3_9HELO|nr:hypothetical protein DSL72_005303 [Monilinia vaccinii-corymbosi]